jgi:hypothetical protein
MKENKHYNQVKKNETNEEVKEIFKNYKIGEEDAMLYGVKEEEDATLYGVKEDDDEEDATLYGVKEDDDEEDEKSINIDWLESYEVLEENKLLNKEKVKKIKCKYLYLNKDKEVEKIKTEILDIQNGIINKNELLKIIKQNNDKYYSLFSILLYNVDNDNINITNFFKEYNFIKKINIYEDIKINDTINIFLHINEIFIFFIRKEITKKNKTIKNKRNKTKII